MDRRRERMRYGISDDREDAGAAVDLIGAIHVAHFLDGKLSGCGGTLYGRISQRTAEPQAEDAGSETLFAHGDGDYIGAGARGFEDSRGIAEGVALSGNFDGVAMAAI